MIIYPGIVYSSATDLLYQLSGIRSYCVRFLVSTPLSSRLLIIKRLNRCALTYATRFQLVPKYDGSERLVKTYPCFVCERAAVAGDGEKRLESLLVEVSFRILGRVIGHHRTREGVAGRVYENARKWWVEEVGIASNRVIEACLTEW